MPTNGRLFSMFIKLLAKVVSSAVRIVHSHILSRIRAQKCIDAFEKFIFSLYNKKNK